MMVRMVDRLVAELGLWRLTLVSGGEREFTLEELEGLPSQEVTVGEHTYKGISLLTLLVSSEIDLTTVQSLSAVASDGASVDYKPEELDGGSPLLTWELDGGPLPEELGTVALLHQGETQVKRLERIIVAFKAEEG